MPTRAPRACGHTGCGGIAGQCPEHDALRAARTRARLARRGTTAARGYDSPWRTLVAQAKRAQRAIYGQTFCVDCGITEEQGAAEDNPITGDHLRWPAVTIDDVAVVCRRDNSRRGRLRASVSGPVV